MDCSTPALPVDHQLPEFTQTHVHWVGNAIQPSHPLSCPSPLAFNLSQHQSLFKWVSFSYQVAKVLEFRFRLPVNIYLVLISFRIDWLDLIAVQGTLKSLLQHHSSETSILHWIIEKAREFQKNIYFCFIDYTKAFDCVDHNKLLKILKEMGIPDHLTCLLRNLYAGQEATVRTGHGTTD